MLSLPASLFAGGAMLPLLLLAIAIAPPERSPTDTGDRLLRDYFKHQGLALRENGIAAVRDAAAWQRNREQRRREFFAMMGLDPLPARSPLKATLTGKLETPHYRVEKLHFQSLPGLYVTANLYLPRKVDKPLPTILYLCGHGAQIADGVSYGNKVTYQHHGTWFAEHGYACLIVDTLQLGEVQGLHHGTHRLGMWWWQSLGYTPAGIELWNAIRALDYLETRPEVDKKRFGVTGRSGGGASSWWIMAADDRIQCGVPVAGLADMYAHVSAGSPGRLANGVIGGHCDCMYFTNTYRWDFIQVMALCAPRPLLLGNSDVDTIFPVPGYRRPAEPIKKLYADLGAADKFDLLETKGPHKDTPELRRGAFAWLNRWLKNDTGEVAMPERERHPPKDLKVFDRNPPDAINDIIHERLIRPTSHEIPASPEVAQAWWKGKAADWKKQLQSQVFAGWPDKPAPLEAKSTEQTIEGIHITAVDFTSETGVPLRAWLLRVGEPKEVLINICNEKDWAKWVADLGPAFADILHGAGNPAPKPYPPAQPERLDTLRRTMRAYHWGFAIVAPRGIGPTRWDPREPQHLRRRFALLGQTLEGQQVWDARRALQALPLGKAKRTLQASGNAAITSIYTALFEPQVARLELTHVPTSHRSGPALLNVLRVLDVPQAVALLAPREVVLTGSPKDWAWPLALQAKLGTPLLTIKRED
jgi:hypothetical protein